MNSMTFWNKNNRTQDGFLDVGKVIEDIFSPHIASFGLQSSVSKQVYSICSGGIDIEMPGVKREDVTVELEGDRLDVRWKDRHGNQQFLQFVDVASGQDPEITLKDGILNIKTNAATKPERKKLSVG